MKLTAGDCIRIGCSFGPQVTNMWVRDTPKMESCALGAFLLGVGITFKEIVQIVKEDLAIQDIFEPLQREYPVLGTRLVPCPVPKKDCENCTIRFYDMLFAIVHLNDDHGLSREAIALWIDTLEDKKDIETQQPITEEVLYEA